MNREKKRTLAHFLIAAVCLIFGISTLAMLSGFEPFYSLYYSFAWWSYIIFIESFLYCRGAKSLLFENPGKFLLLLPLSTTVWLVFEALNFRLSNWHYLNIPSETVIRWTGYFIAYSTVLPGIFATTALLDFIGVSKNSKVAPLDNLQSLRSVPQPKSRRSTRRVGPNAYKPFILTGILFLLLPLVWPEYFFPLVWGAFIFLLEPVNHKAGAPSLLREWRNGSLKNFYLLLLAGAICGLLWELWNFRAGSKWIYTVPHAGFLKIFEMPLFGFLGFPPFALECYAMSAAFFLLISKIREKYSPGRALCIYSTVAVLVALFDILVFAGIDRFTVISFQEFNFIGVRP
ncbi:MAG: hypothetical protein ABSF90_08865 [Syntrophobacteraceae bacterium]|jgi:hypothetical protein